jgi:N-acetyl-gamma-glutamyl-phosphate reductase
MVLRLRGPANPSYLPQQLIQGVQAMRKRLFIDGEAGTTGLEIFGRLHERPDLEIIRLAPERRKDPGARRDALNTADLAVLCLPDAAAIEAVALVENPATRILDASTAHRILPDWAYGFAELTPGQDARILSASRVANPGCFATGAIALLRPLIEAGVLAPEYPVTLNAVSGYTGGGKAMIASFEQPGAPDPIASGFLEYGLTFEHKHVPEIVTHAGLAAPPLFIPSVGRFPRGMLVNLPLQLWALPDRLTGEDIHAIYQEHYPATGQVRVKPLRQVEGKNGAEDRIMADELANTDWLDIHLYWNARTGQALAVASFDNLGKGACGATIQNIGLMLGLEGLA